jgi:RNA polymerase sigma-70 factor (ECF subfamily)
MTTKSTDSLLAAAQAGDPHALERLLVQHRHGVYRYGLTVCRTTEDAEDAVQETLWAATRAIRAFRGSATSLAAWLFTIVRRECFRLLERGRTAPKETLDVDGSDAIDLAISPEDELAMRERGALLASALGALEPLHREVILLRDVQGESAPEVAAKLGISIDAVKSRLHRARVSLREQVLRRTRGQRPHANPVNVAPAHGRNVRGLA